MSTLLDSTLFSSAAEANAWVSGILDSSTEYAITGKDLQGNIVLWNEGARRIYGYTAEEVVGKANYLILDTPEDLRAGVPQQRLEAARRNGKWERNVVRLRKNGKRFVAGIVITPRVDSFGETIGFLVIARDVSHAVGLTDELKAVQVDSIEAIMNVDLRGWNRN
ncbi:MAG: PAS domain-containing protein [Tepidisphaeraceae bacterium]|jgi:PAS domain S-box-containing protein